MNKEDLINIHSLISSALNSMRELDASLKLTHKYSLQPELIAELEVAKNMMEDCLGFKKYTAIYMVRVGGYGNQSVTNMMHITCLPENLVKATEEAIDNDFSAVWMMLEGHCQQVEY